MVSVSEDGNAVGLTSIVDGEQFVFHCALSALLCVAMLL